MPILYVNPSRGRRKKMRISGRAKIGKASRARRNPARKGKRKGRRRMPAALAAYWAKKRGGKSRKSKRKGKARRTGARRKRRARKPVKESKMPRRRKRRSARKARRKSPRRSRRRGRKKSARKGRRKSRRRGRRKSPRRSRRRGRRKARKSRRRGRRKSPRRSRRRGRRKARKSRRRARRRRSIHTAKTVKLRRGPGGTVVINPTRRRRRKSRRRGRRGRRRVQRRYGRRYRRNPGGMLLDLAKRAAPVLIGLYGARVLVSKIGPRIPMVSKLGTFSGPALAIGAVLLVNFVTKKVGKLAKYRSELLLGTGLNALDTLISTFAPASVKGLIGAGDVYDRALGDYVSLQGGMGDYLYDGAGGPPLNENLEMGDYVSIGDVEEELGLVEEELGMVEEELGNIGGVSGGALLKAVPSVQMLAPVPDRSFVKNVPPATAAFDNPSQLYRGIFAS